MAGSIASSWQGFHWGFCCIPPDRSFSPELLTLPVPPALTKPGTQLLSPPPHPLPIPVGMLIYSMAQMEALINFPH